MDMDGLCLVLLFILIGFVAGVTFGVCQVKYENKKPPITEEEMEQRIRETLLEMDLIQLLEWLRK